MANEINLDALASMGYPGRFIIIGQNRSMPFAVYGITGRSESSQARRFNVSSKGGVAYAVDVEPLDLEDMKKKGGDPALLVYRAVSNALDILAVSNGAQTRDIHGAARYPKNGYDAVATLHDSLYRWTYEPDEPNYTPRISGLIMPLGLAAMAIIKKPEGSTAPVKNDFTVPLIEGTGKLISTYTGVNAKPLPSFVGEPLDVRLQCENSEEIAHRVWEALNPDYRVSVVCVSVREQAYVINRHG